MNGRSNIKQYRIGSVKTRFYYDIKRGLACLSGSASRKTKRQIKRIASRANRQLIKKVSKEFL